MTDIYARVYAPAFWAANLCAVWGASVKFGVPTALVVGACFIAIGGMLDRRRDERARRRKAVADRLLLSAHPLRGATTGGSTNPIHTTALGTTQRP